jgi:hypothetical protein
MVHPGQVATGAPHARLELFNLAIDSKLRGCDLVALPVDDVAPNGYPLTAPISARQRPRPARGGHTRIENTFRYLGKVDDALEIAEKIDV